ncbi:MAG: isopentenyl-diphosphate Delta-isomerase [Planctomycetales bacterium]|nr:isopentenyl-diphosphate Delta-isomerase [Planctomycetales bacterium]
MSTWQQVLLVDESDEPQGLAEKLAAHQHGGQLHRAFSVLVFNANGELLLQRRAIDKYHFGGLWSNTCCGHPTGARDITLDAEKRLFEEFGFHTTLESRFVFLYVAHDAASGLTEREIDHVLVGRFLGEPAPDATEISEFKWINPQTLLEDMKSEPEQYTPWFRILMEDKRAWALLEAVSK